MTQFIQTDKEGKVSPATMLKFSSFTNEIEKIANPGIDTFLKYLATGLAMSAGMGLAAGAASLGVKAYEEHQMESHKDELFREVTKLHPELMQNKERAKLYFEALLHFSPVIAQNPLTAGAYVKQALQYDHVAGGPLPSSVNELAQIQKSTSESKKNAPKSTLGTMAAGFGEASTKMVPSFMSYGDFTATPDPADPTIGLKMQNLELQNQKIQYDLAHPRR